MISIDNTMIDDEKKWIVDEQAYVRRLDKRLLAFAMFGNMVKTLDNSNLGSAFISGMEEELTITGVQYNWMGVLFMIGYLSMQIPSNMLLARCRPSIYLPLLETTWCILTISMACVNSVQSVYVIRFCLGLAEAGFYPGIVFLLGTWYTKRELGKRMALLNLCGALGTGMSGLVQAVMLKTMDGVWGLSGWRWMFLFDALVTSILASFGYNYLPDYPTTTSWLNKSEKAIAIQRGENNSISRDIKKDGGNRWAKLKILTTNKYIYPFTLGWASLHVALGACHVLGITAKKLGYDAVTANLLTTPDTLITMVVGLSNGFISDRLQSRIWCLLLPASVGLFGTLLLSSFVQPFGFLYFAFIITHAGLGSVTSVVMTWASEIITPNPELRAMSIAAMNTFSSMMWTWTPLVLWPVTDAPQYRRFFYNEYIKNY
ncbi:major facilitator superfamily domain-containing protein [Halteromyces radiatus]|uniref:major facilitator superfamily domain-containing protein n=1 Tax=Halteromyces radiatus TaxID=101107 RepID=UPI0022206C3E|nr:major facilitator superfamily domain-containing protein [Halteromyces radiatus]KAI8099365.1 major facilitator superfamily domain-containing protein [Halteromyces radiatus]